jgi:hypothetical protein
MGSWSEIVEILLITRAVDMNIKRAPSASFETFSARSKMYERIFGFWGECFWLIMRSAIAVDS